MHQTIKRGNLKPDLIITISDNREAADFTGLLPSACTVKGEMDGVVVVSDNPDTVTVAPDGKSAVLKRAWVSGETDQAGRMWFTVDVAWGAGLPQTFPQSGSLSLDIERAAGDA